MPDESLLDLRVSELLDAVAAREPAPGGGAVAALATALAAGLVTMAAGFAADDTGQAWAEQAEQLRARATTLIDADGAAYRRYLAAARSARSSGRAEDATAARAALSDATEVPLEIARLAVEVGRLGAGLAEHGNPRLRGDAAAAVLLASAAAGMAAVLVRENVGPADPRTAQAEAAVSAVRALAAPS